MFYPWHQQLPYLILCLASLITGSLASSKLGKIKFKTSFVTFSFALIVLFFFHEGVGLLYYLGSEGYYANIAMNAIGLHAYYPPDFIFGHPLDKPVIEGTKFNVGTLQQTIAIIASMPVASYVVYRVARNTTGGGGRRTFSIAIPHMIAIAVLVLRDVQAKLLTTGVIK